MGQDCFSRICKSVGMLILGYGIISGLGLGFAYGCTISNSVKFFPDKRGLIGGITTACYGLSSVILPPIATALIGAFGISNTFKILGIAFGIIVCGASLFVKKCPENYQPDGWNPPQQAAGVAAVDKDWREMLKSPIFYVMIAILVCGAFCGLMCTSQAAPIAQNMIGMTGAAAATAVSVLALLTRQEELQPDISLTVLAGSIRSHWHVSWQSLAYCACILAAGRLM